MLDQLNTWTFSFVDARVPDNEFENLNAYQATDANLSKKIDGFGILGKLNS